MTDLIALLRDFEAVYRSDDWRKLNPLVTAEVLRMAINALENGGLAVRRSDPATSRQAAKSVAFRAGSQKYRLLQAYIGLTGLTDEEAGAAAGLNRPGTCYWKRCSELRDAGFIEPLGFTRTASTGEQQQVCGVTMIGREAFERTFLALAS